ncbi:MAG: cytochrome c peroxidase [Pirellulaceae bacterium]
MATIPNGIAVQDDWLVVTSRDRASVLLVNAVDRTVHHELRIGHQPSSIVQAADIFWITDQQNQQLIGVAQQDGKLEEVLRRKTEHSPVSVAASPNGSVLSVACLWARRLDLFQIDPDQPNNFNELVRHTATLDLPFSPHEQCYLDDRHLLVADAFGANLAVVRLTDSSVSHVFQIPGHHIRGIAVVDNEVVLAHQMLTSFIPTSRDHVFWGNVLTNLFRAIPVQEVLNPANANKKIFGTIVPLGGEKRGAGDPDCICVTPNGSVTVALAGVDELAIRHHRNEPFQRIAVGRNPVAIAANETNSAIYVVNRFGNSISIVDTGSNQVTGTISLPAPDVTTTELVGESLFHDSRLALDGWFSCNSCHVDGHTSSQSNDNLGDNHFGDEKRIISLLGTSDTAPWAWNGQQMNLIDQVRKSLLFTMRSSEGKQIGEGEIMALTGYLRTLSPPPGIAIARHDHANQAAAIRGREVFLANDCQSCHQEPALTSRDTYNVGLTSKTGESAFNPPSLRGVSQQQRWLHDGRATSLESVFADHQHPPHTTLSATEISDLLAYLNQL